MVGKFAEMSGGAGASIHVLDPLTGGNGILVEHGVDPEWSVLGRTTYAAMSPIGAAVLVAEVDQPIGAFDFVDEAEYVESRFYQEWLAPKGYHDMLGALISKSARGIGAVSAIRLKERGRFTAEDREFVGLIAPHIRRAVTISGQLDYRAVNAVGLTALVHQLTAAVCFVDRGGRLLRANPAAESMLSAGELLQARTDRLTVGDRAADRSLQEALAAGSPEPVVFGAHTEAGELFSVSVLALRQERGVSIVIVKSSDQPFPAVGGFLASGFGLSPREISVLLPMLGGAGPQEVADALGISVATVRSHLNRLFQKTGTTRQGELVARVLAAMPPAG